MPELQPDRIERTLLPEWKKHLWWKNLEIPLLIMAVAWTLYAVSALFGIDILAYIKRRRFDRADDPRTMYLYLAIGFSVVAISYALHGIRRALQMAARGILVQAEYRSTAGFSFKGLTRVNFKYELNGLPYDYATSVISDLAEDYRTGARRMILAVDPENHRRAINADDVFPRKVLFSLCPGKKDAAVQFDEWAQEDDPVAPETDIP